MKDMEAHHLEIVWILLVQLEILMKYNHHVFNVCFLFPSFLFFSYCKKKKKKKKIVPEPVANIRVDAKPNLAIISWDVPKRAMKYHVYLVIQEMLIPINNGEGLDVTTTIVTMNSVFFSFPKILFTKKFQIIISKKKKVD